MRRTFWREVSPRRTVIARRGRSSRSARNSQSASLARPSTGGAWTTTDRGLDFQGDRVREGFKGLIGDWILLIGDWIYCD